VSKAEQVETTRDYTVREAAELAGVDPSYLRRLLIEGKRLRGRKRANAWFISGVEVKRWLEQRE
jgi:excisionase family DNA binding protein